MSRITACLLLLVALVTSPALLSAQIRGRAPVQSGNTRWTITGGASAAILSDINDGATGSTWKFGSDPLLLYRGSIEKSLDEATTIGISAAYGKADLTVVPFAPESMDGLRNVPMPIPASCFAGCEAQTDIYQAMAQFRSGGGEGFHTFFEANGGVTSFRNMRTKTDQVALGKSTGSLDLSGTLGGGFGYTLSQKLAVQLVQDFGIGFHSKDDLPNGMGRSWRIRNTRVALRVAF